MAKGRTLILAAIGLTILASTSGCIPLLMGSAPIPIPVPPWVPERMEEKYATRLKHRTPVMPPILPGMQPPTCEDEPALEEIIRAIPRVPRGIPFVYEVQRDDFNTVVEKLVDQIDPPTFVPLLGPAQLHHCHFKCTVHYKERIVSHYPFPTWVENDCVEVVYIDKDHYHQVVGPDQRAQRSIGRDLSGP